LELPGSLRIPLAGQGRENRRSDEDRKEFKDSVPSRQKICVNSGGGRLDAAWGAAKMG
jgi:hypothetical protein